MINIRLGTRIWCRLFLVWIAAGHAAFAQDLPQSPAETTVQAFAPTFVKAWGQQGDQPGEFHSPICLALNPQGELVVADLNNARIQRFTTEGDFLAQFDLPIDQPPRKSTLVGGLLIAPSGEIYVAFMIQHKIGVYSPEGMLLREWGRLGAADGEFNQPGGMVFLPDGTLLVADQCNHRVQHFTPEGTFLGKWGEHGTSPGQFGGDEPAGSRFAGPHFLTQDSQGRLYTTEGALGRIQQLSAEGLPQAAWGSKSAEPGSFGEYAFNEKGNTFGPIGVLADRWDQIWVSSLNDRVQCFTPLGKFLCRLDGSDPEHPFLHPHGMVMDDKGHLYVADSGNQRIVKFLVPAP